MDESTKPGLPTAVPPGARYALFLVAATLAMSLLDRQILAILAPEIKADLGIGDAEMGMLYGTVFALFYALFSLPLGRLADGWFRTKLLGACLLFWSASTALAGVASSFAILALSRLGVGIGEAAAQPAGTSLLYDYWPRRRRGFVMAVYAAAISIGLGASIVLGGVAADWWDGLYAEGTAPLGLAGWQFAFLVASMPGIVLAFFLYRLREPERGVMDGIETPPDPEPFRASLRVLGSVTPGFNWLNLKRNHAGAGLWTRNLLMLAAIVAAMAALVAITSAVAPRPAIPLGAVSINPHLLQWGVIGFGLFVIVNLMQGMSLTDAESYRVITRSPSLIMVMVVGALQSVINYGVMGFTPLFLIQYYQLSLAETALTFGLLSAALGIAGPLIAGPFSDMMQARFPGRGRAYVALFAMGVSPIFSLWVYSATDPLSFYIRFALYSIILTGWMPPLYAIMYDQVLPRMRGITSSVYLMVMTILGLGIGPYMVGMISDATGNLRAAIMSINIVGPMIVVLLLIVARRAQKDEASLLERASGGAPA